jgi:hypothetical protein
MDTKIVIFYNGVGEDITHLKDQFDTVGSLRTWVAKNWKISPNAFTLSFTVDRSTTPDNFLNPPPDTPSDKDQVQDFLCNNQRNQIWVKIKK